MNSSVFTFRLSNVAKKSLTKISKDENIPAGQIIREAVERYLAVRKFRNIRKKVSAVAHSQGLFTDEDIFKKIK